MQIDIIKKKQKRTFLIMIIIVICYLLFSSPLINNFNTLIASVNFGVGVVEMFRLFYPTVESFAQLGRIGKELFNTVIVSISATIVATIVALLFAFLSSKALKSNKAIRFFLRTLSNIIRNIPIVAWAMILLLSFKQSEFTGFMALFFTTYGLLFRIFVDIIDTTGTKVMEAMDAVGALYLHKIFCSIIPAILPQLISWILYMIETNIRSATLVGLLTGTGVGFLFDFYFKSFRYHDAGLTIIGIIVIVLIIEQLSNRLRKVVLQ